MNLITDRTAADVAESKRLNKLSSFTAEEYARYKDNKGSYNHNDLNRVGQACAELYERLTDAGYAVPGYEALPTNWMKTTRPTTAQLNRYLATIAAIKAALPTTTPIPETWRKLTVDGANNIEKMLLEVEDIINRIEAIYIRSGTQYSGTQFYIAEVTT